MRQLIYVSAATAPLDDVEIADLLMQCRENNAADGLTGVLLYGDMGFFQVLEGPEEPLLALYRKIDCDPRHRRVTKLIDRAIERRSFPTWSMGADRLDPRTASEDLFAIDAGMLAASKLQEDDGVIRVLAGTFLDAYCHCAG